MSSIVKLVIASAIGALTQRALASIPGRQPPPPSRFKRLGSALPTLAIGAIVMYFCDPQSGRRRRAVTRDRFAAWIRAASRQTGRRSRYIAGKGRGVAHKLEGSQPAPLHNDVTLQHKIESEVLRHFPKGHVNVNVEEGVAVLRGQLDRPAQINSLVEATRQVDGIVDVRSLLHLPGTDAPTWESAARVRRR